LVQLHRVGVPLLLPLLLGEGALTLRRGGLLGRRAGVQGQGGGLRGGGGGGRSRVRLGRQSQVRGHIQIIAHCRVPPKIYISYVCMFVCYLSYVSVCSHFQNQRRAQAANSRSSKI